MTLYTKIRVKPITLMEMQL